MTRKKLRIHDNELKAIKRRMVRELRLKGCSKCGGHDDLEFHHLTYKQFNIGEAVSDNRISKHKLQSELKKCVVLCHDCHRELHRIEDLGGAVLTYG